MQEKNIILRWFTCQQADEFKSSSEIKSDVIFENLIQMWRTLQSWCRKKTFNIVSWLMKNDRFLNELIYEKKECYFMKYISIRNQWKINKMMRLLSHSSFNYVLSLSFLIWERCLIICWMIERRVRSLKTYNQRSDHNMWWWNNILLSNSSLFMLLRSMY